MTPMLEMRGITKVFAGTAALSSASLAVSAAEIHGLLGENGAGKSTMIRILAGVLSADAGEIFIDGIQLRNGHTPAESARAGVAFLHQDFGLVGDMSIAENIALAVGFRRRSGFIDWGATMRTARNAMLPFGVDMPPERLINELPIGSRALVGIARAVASQAKILVLDEPTASLTAAEVGVLFGLLRRLRDSGVACVFVSHRLDEVHALCDRVTVLRDGETVGCVRMADVRPQDIVRMIVGHDMIHTRHLKAASSEQTRLEAVELRGTSVGPVSFRAQVGEILGVTGLSDSGVTEVGDILFGRKRLVGGQLLLNRAPFAPANPVEAIAAGVAFVPADRNSEGLVQNMTLRENLYLNPSVGNMLRRHSPTLSGDKQGSIRILWARREQAAASSALRKYDVRPPRPEQETSTLSGGNAQKLLLAKWLSLEPSLLVLNEPTAGVDVGAREEIYSFLRAGASAGCTCIVISSDFTEIAQLCDRAIILYRGRISRELMGDALSPRSVAAASLDPGVEV